MVYDAIVLGSGVAGLTAGLYLGRANKSVMIIESSVLGGTVASLETIDNYPGLPHVSGEKLINTLLSQVAELGVNIDFLPVSSIDFDNKMVICDNIRLEYKTLIIATGSSYKTLNLPGIDRYRFKGVSYCAVCDGRLYKGKNIVVITDGNSGVGSIEYLSNLTDSISVVNISSNNCKITKSNICVYDGAKVLDISGDNFVSNIQIEMNDSTIDIPCDGIFVSLGKASDIGLFKDKIKCANGHICSDENMHTNIDGVYVAGDIRNKSLRQIITAMSDGAIAGTEAIKYLSK